MWHLARSVKMEEATSPPSTKSFTRVPKRTSFSKAYILIYVLAGVYEEYVSIDRVKTFMMMIGDGINKTIITGNHSSQDGWDTFKFATFAVDGEGFVAVNITFRNTAGPGKYQAVAVLNTANMSVFYSYNFEGYQNTLYDCAPAPHIESLGRVIMSLPLPLLLNSLSPSSCPGILGCPH
ncbi:hypothetical protein K1719_026025 [Acacia pycnantha]|nr:hypothetical protein K1719_026025 [Acacia pycnantha]